MYRPGTTYQQMQGVAFVSVNKKRVIAPRDHGRCRTIEMAADLFPLWWSRHR